MGMNYCYNCGEKITYDQYCPRCGFDLNPPPDVYCNQHTCDDYDCGADVPRWANYCPMCGRKLKKYNPMDMEARKARHKSLFFGTLAWTAIAFGIAIIVGLTQEDIPFKIPLIVAGAVSVLFFIMMLCRRERGKVKYGTIVKHWTELSYESRVIADEKTIFNNRRFDKVEVTLYKTEIRWDDGSKDITVMHNCAANFIQLRPGDRIMKFLSTGEFEKI